MLIPDYTTIVCSLLLQAMSDSQKASIHLTGISTWKLKFYARADFGYGQEDLVV